MTAQIPVLIDKQDTAEIALDAIATILAEESAQQQVLAAIPAVAYDRSDASDYTVAAAESGAQVGDFVITAGTLVAGVGTWTAVAPDGTTTEDETTVAADDDLLFPGLGLTLTTTAGDTAWETGDIITVTVRNPLQWRIRIFTHRTHAWTDWVNSPPQDDAEAVPIVCVNFDQDSVDKAKGDIFYTQQGLARFSIDCFGYGKSAETATGHTPGDEKANTEALRALRLVRNILMSPYHVELGHADTIGQRMVESRQRFPPEAFESHAQNIAGWRLTLGVDIEESTDQIDGTACTLIVGTVYRAEDGEILFTITKDFSG